MFAFCEAIRWSHLPVAGGIYDQDPQLLEEFQIIFRARAEKDDKERKERERKDRASSRHGGRGRRH